ncbi:MAG: rRNA pseudouridine synthase [bacterium]|nr:rRNA pseudouridine synthase [bacterium]
MKYIKKPKKAEPKPASDKPLFPMRINRYLALQKHSTRRGADEIIEKGLVFINGTVAELGSKVTETDKVEVRFRGPRKKLLYFAYNKPRGIVTHSAQGEDSDIEDIFPVKGVFPLGRLDKDSNGLILLSSDGRVTERLLGPKYEHEKEYVVKTKNALRKNFKEKMEAGVRIENEVTKKCKVAVLSNRSFRVILTEGKKHQIRRMCSALFQEVEDLKRIRVMNINLGKLAPGDYRPIEGEELQSFLTALEL